MAAGPARAPQDAGSRRSGAMGRRRIPAMSPKPASRARRLALRVLPGSRSDGEASEAAWALARPRSARCDGCGSRRFANSPAGGRSAIREAGEFAYCGLAPAERSLLLRRPLPDGLPVAARADEAEPHCRAGDARAGRFVAARLSAPTRDPRSSRTRRRGLARPRPLRAASRPTARGAAEAGAGRGRLDIGPAVGEPHRRLEPETVALRRVRRRRRRGRPRRARSRRAANRASRSPI